MSDAVSGMDPWFFARSCTKAMASAKEDADQARLGSDCIMTRTLWTLNGYQLPSISSARHYVGPFSQEWD